MISKVRLDTPDYDDQRKIVDWLNDPSIMASLSRTRLVHGQLPCADDGRSTRGELFSVYAKANDLVGVVALDNIHDVHRTAEIWIVIDPKRQRRGYGGGTLMALIAHASQIRNLRKLYAHILEPNEPSKGLFRSVGFGCEAVLTSDRWFVDRYVDLEIWSCLLSDRRIL